MKRGRLIWDEAVSADEVFMCGTALEIQAVRAIDGRIIGSGSPGWITKQIMREYSDAANGRIPKHLAWCDMIEDAPTIRKLIIFRKSLMSKMVD